MPPSPVALRAQGGRVAAAASRAAFATPTPLSITRGSANAHVHARSSSRSPPRASTSSRRAASAAAGTTELSPLQSAAAAARDAAAAAATADASADTASDGIKIDASSAPLAAKQGDEGITYRGEIFCNRALNMARIKAVGFDMDYTLAMYHSERFENLSAAGALEKLVNELGYPKELLDVKYDHDFFIRGLVVDKERGNILKLDRHKYVKSAYHAFTPLTKAQRTAIYTEDTEIGSRTGFLEPQYALLDTLFSLPDAYLFSAVVDYKDKHPGTIKQDYSSIYRDVRRSVDMCHRDGSIKDIVSREPENYIQTDPAMFDMLGNIRASGRKVFLLTNSLWDYTNTVMSFMYRDAGLGTCPDGSDWTDEFDLIISGSCKPAFIVDRSRPIYRCDTKTGVLSNTDSPHDETTSEYLAREGKSFQGGNYTHLHDMLDIAHGSQVLYVGDHIYSDVVRSKRTLGWRTMLIVPELEHEVQMLRDPECVALNQRIWEKRAKRDELDEWIDRLESSLVKERNDLPEKKRAELEKECGKARAEMEEMRADIIGETDKLHTKFHPVWGQMLKCGPQNSRFAEQVENYACLYTSKVTNLSLVSPEFYWRAMPDLMPHDRFLETPMTRLLTRRHSVLENGGAD